MSDASSPGTATAPDALELAALLCSRVCHDLISPVGAIVNGLEVLDDDPKPEDREFALDLIRKSAKTASARLQFCRLAFGAAGSSGAQIDLGDAQTMARGHIEDGKCSITWNLPRLLLPKNRVKLLLNMLVVSQHTIPRGGMLTIDPIGDGETMSFRVTATGHNAREPAAEHLRAPERRARPGRGCARDPALLYAAVGGGLRAHREARARGRSDHHYRVVSAPPPSNVNRIFTRRFGLSGAPYLFVGSVLLHILNHY
ncbi:hypothetical protein ACVWZ3_000650 [Bradyrhizobium sp. i1.3.6]